MPSALGSWETEIREEVLIDSFIQQVSWTPAALGGIPDFHMHVNHLGILLKKQILAQHEGEWGQRCYISSKFPGDANAPGHYEQ